MRLLSLDCRQAAREPLSDVRENNNEKISDCELSMIAGIAIIGLGVVLKPVSLGASIVFVGLGVSLVGNTCCESSKEIFFSPKPQPSGQLNFSFKQAPTGAMPITRMNEVTQDV